MDHTPESMPAFPAPGSPIPDGERLEALLRQTFEEQGATVTAPSDALARLEARLDAANPLKRWFGPLRLAGAVAAALLILALVTPVGRLAAAGVSSVTQTIITTVKQIASGDTGNDTPPPRGTISVPSATDASASQVVPTNGAGSPGTRGTVNAPPTPLSPTPTPRATDQPATTGTAAGTASTTTVRSTITVPTTTANPAPPATTPAITPTAAAKGTATTVNETVSPAPKPPTRIAITPTAPSPGTASPPGPAPTGEADTGQGE